MAWHEDRFRAVEQFLQRAHIVRHAALGRGDDSRVPGHHVIAAEQDVAVGLCEAEVIRRVTRCEQRFEAPIRAGDRVAVLHNDVGGEVDVDELGAGRARLQAARRTA